MQTIDNEFYMFMGSDVGPNRKKIAITTAAFQFVKSLPTNIKIRLMGMRGAKMPPPGLGKRYVNNWKKFSEITAHSPKKSPIYGLHFWKGFVKII